MKTNFYDIESLDNVFTLCNFKAEENKVDIFYLCDDQSMIPDRNTFYNMLLDRIYEKNANFRGEVILYDLSLRESNDYLAETFGLSDAYLVNNPSDKGHYAPEFRPVCDTDPDYDDNEHPYLFGYNSNNYDTTMLSLYLYETYPLVKTDAFHSHMDFHVTTANLMRRYNDDLFTPMFKDCMPTYLTRSYDRTSHSFSSSNYSDTRWKIRKSMLMTGRHLDVARLNEKQSKVALKRLLGMLGFQILESDKLKQGQNHIENLDQLLELIAYNISDCVNLHQLFHHKTYMSNFKLKRGLLKTYPDIVYEKKDDAYAPDIRPEKVSRSRMFIDSPSAQLATKSLCPYGHLPDIEYVSFLYPAKEKAEELGIPQVNVLEETKKFFFNHFHQPELRAKFMEIYNYYKSIEGKNFNASKNYDEDYGLFGDHEPYKLADIPKINGCMPYYNKDGSPSSCFIVFSTGGIHGAEYNKVLYDHDVAEYQKIKTEFEYVQALYPNPTDLKAAKSVILPDGTKKLASKFLKTGATLSHAEYKDYEKNEPHLFVKSKSQTKHGEKKDGWSLNAKYAFTSAAPTNHEDFESYYPNMLRMLRAFYNPGLGYDRYAEIFENKSRYGKMMKDKEKYTAPEREEFSILREGTKLVLNSASGAGDATFESNIRMNNMIISMRIIGQLFTWRIGQAQTLEGASVISTNTDGLYTVMEENLNNKLLAQESANIGVRITPETMYLITKDSNNRIEMDDKTGKVENASGGTLGCHNGPTPTKSLNHPAITDWALTEYLIVSALKTKPEVGLDKPFDLITGRNILDSATRFIGTEFNEDGSKNKDYRVKYLTMFQNVIASSIGSMSYIFASKDDKPNEPIIMQHYNRVFIMKDGTPNTVHLKAAVGKEITDATRTKRIRDNLKPQQHDMLAIMVLNANGINVSDLGKNKEATIKKVTNVEESWNMYICNKDLHYLSDEEFNFICDNLDIEKYLNLLSSCFEKNWLNHMPEPDETPDVSMQDSVAALTANESTVPMTLTMELQTEIADHTVSVNQYQTSDVNVIKTIAESIPNA